MLPSNKSCFYRLGFLISAFGMSLKQTVKLSDICFSVAFHDGKLFAGIKGGVEVVDNRSHSKLINNDYKETGSASVTCIQFYGSKMYTLFHHGRSRWSIRVYCLNGTFLRCWTVQDSSEHVNKFLIINEIVYVPSRTNKKIHCHHITAFRTRKDICVNEMHDSATTMCMTHR